MDSSRTFTPHGAPIRDKRLLPVQPPGQVIGRNRELATMHVTLKARAPILLAGSSGIGKSALAAVLATAHVASNPGGVLWLNVLEDDLETLIARVGRAYGVHFPGDEMDFKSPLVENIRAALSNQKPLLVLDGLVDIEAAREFIRQVAAGLPAIIIHDEMAAGPWTPITLGPLSQADSHAVFRFYGQFYDNFYAADIEAMCKFLDGFPMTLELAGRQAVVEDQTPAELLSSLPSSTGVDSQQTLMALTFKRLSSSVQGMLLVLAALSSGSATAEFIGDLSNVPPANVVPLLRQLVVRGLARESIIFGQLAYTLHEIAHSYSRAWLRNYQRLQGIEVRAMQSIVNYVERHARNTTADHNRIAAEMENVLHIAAYATENKRADVLQRLIRALSEGAGDFAKLRGFEPELTQIRKLASLLVPTASQSASKPSLPNGPTGPRTAVPPGFPAVTTRTAPTPVEPLADSQATPIVQRLMRTPKPPLILEPDQELAEETQNAVAAAWLDEGDATQITNVRPKVAPPISSLPTDPTEIEHQLAEARSSSDEARQVALLARLGQAHLDQNDWSRAQAAYQQALQVAESAVERVGRVLTADVLDMLALITERKGDLEAAFAHASRGVEVAQRSGENSLLGRLQTRLGDAKLASGEAAPAVEAYSRAVEALRSTGDWLAIGLTMGKLGNAYLALGNWQEALQVLEPALAIFRKEGRQDQECLVLAKMGIAYGRLQRWLTAQDYHQQALALATERSDRRLEADELAEIAEICLLQNDRARALLHFRQALHLAYALRSKPLQARYAFHLGNLLVDDLRTLKLAIQLLRESAEKHPDSETTRLLSRAETRLKRSEAAKVPVPPAEGSNRDYAAGAYLA